MKTAAEYLHAQIELRYGLGYGPFPNRESQIATLSRILRNEKIPHSPALYDEAGICLTCGEPAGNCPGAHTFEEIQQAAREAAQMTALPLPASLWRTLTPVTEYTFPTEETAQEAWAYLDKMGRQGNNQATVAHRDGLRVYLRPEFISARLMKELAELGHCATLEAKGTATP